MPTLKKILIYLAIAAACLYLFMWLLVHLVQPKQHVIESEFKTSVVK